MMSTALHQKCHQQFSLLFHFAKQSRRVNKEGGVVRGTHWCKQHHMTGYPAAHAKLITTFSKQVWERRQREILQKRLPV